MPLHYVELFFTVRNVRNYKRNHSNKWILKTWLLNIGIEQNKHKEISELKSMA